MSRACTRGWTAGAASDPTRPPIAATVSSRPTSVDEAPSDRRATTIATIAIPFETKFEPASSRTVVRRNGSRQTCETPSAISCRSRVRSAGPSWNSTLMSRSPIAEAQ